MDFPQHQIAPTNIASFGIFSMAGFPVRISGSISTTSSSGTVWPSANLAIFVPFTIPMLFLALSAGISNGSTVSGNVDIGIYDVNGNRLASTGATAQAGTTNTQVIALTAATLLQPGSYYMALSLSSGTATTRRWLDTLIFHQLCGVAEMAAAHPLPTSATLATPTTFAGYLPAFAISSIPSGSW